jgi:hypothetical protein
MLLLGLGVSCSTPKPAADAKQPDYRLVATIKDLMDAQIDPSADFIWNSVSTMVTPAGSVTKAPRNPEEWKEVRRHAITLLEATNLMIMPGRHVANPGEKADDPKVELAPEEIEAKINQDRESWNKHVQDLFDSTMETLKTIDNKDADALFNISNKIDAACESCHKKYWYPNDPGPPKL